MKIIYLTLIALSLFVSCEKFGMDKKYPIHFTNNSSQNVVGYLGFMYDLGAEYPDTTFPKLNSSILGFYKPNMKGLLLDSSIPLEDIFIDALPKDTLSIFIFNADTLQKYPWDTIRKRYMVLQRYDLSLQDLKNRKSFIEFPYDSTKGKLKVWPRK